MTTRKVTLDIGASSVNSRVLLDGEVVPNVRAVTVRAGVGEATTVALELINVNVVGDVIVDATDITSSEKRYVVGDDD